jgi:hypothetical protein
MAWSEPCRSSAECAADISGQLQFWFFQSRILNRCSRLNRDGTSNHAWRIAISGMSAIGMNSFIFEMMCCKRQAKNPSNVMANAWDICAS